MHLHRVLVEQLWNLVGVLLASFLIWVSKEWAQSSKNVEVVGEERDEQAQIELDQLASTAKACYARKTQKMQTRAA